MNPFVKMLLALTAFIAVAVAGVVLTDESVGKMNQGVMEYNKEIIIKAANKSPEKFAAFDMSTLDCRAMDMKGALAITVPTLCYAKNKNGVEVDITDLFESVAKEQDGK